MFLFLLSPMHLLQNLCGFSAHASPRPVPSLRLHHPLSLSLSLTHSLALRWRGEGGLGGTKKRKCEHQQKNGCLASCIIFRNKQCETVLASLLAYAHKERACVPVSKIKGKHKKEANVTLRYPWRRFLKEIALWVNMWSPQIQSAQTKGDKQWSRANSSLFFFSFL